MKKLITFALALIAPAVFATDPATAPPTPSAAAAAPATATVTPVPSAAATPAKSAAEKSPDRQVSVKKHHRKHHPKKVAAPAPVAKEEPAAK